MKIFWIRHLPIATTGRYIGHTDVPALIPQEPADFSMSLPTNALWFASPMLRTIETAHWLLDSIGNKTIKLEIADELMEQNFGIWENKTYEEVIWQNWSNPAMIKPENGESFIGVCVRVDGWIEEKMKLADGKPLIIVAHAGTIRAALRHALNLIPQQALSFVVDYGSITQVEYFLPYNGSGGARVDYVNR